MNFLRDLFKTWFCKHDYFYVLECEYTPSRPKYLTGKYCINETQAYAFTFVIYVVCKKCYHKKEIAEFWGKYTTQQINSFLQNLNKK